MTSILLTSLIQVNYLIDEACNTGKGGNTIISMLHHFFAVHGLGEKRGHFHCDNCAGQNKNRFLMFYMMYRCANDLHDDIKISFLPVGHTKFSPDWCFGLFKQHFRRSKVGCLDDIVRVVNESAAPNVAQLVGSQSGEMLVPMYDWSSYFDDITVKTALKGITQMHHFHFSKSFPGKVKVRNNTDDNWRTINLLKDPSWRPSSLPKQLIPPGLSLERQWYLHDKIREFCPEHCRDLVCPEPSQPL